MNKKTADAFASNQPIKLLSVIIATFNEVSTIALTLTKLSGVLKTLNCSFEIIVVESNSSDETRKILKNIENQLNLKLIFKITLRGKVLQFDWE